MTLTAAAESPAPLALVLKLDRDFQNFAVFSDPTRALLLVLRLDSDAARALQCSFFFVIIIFFFLLACFFRRLAHNEHGAGRADVPRFTSLHKFLLQAPVLNFAVMFCIVAFETLPGDEIAQNIDLGLSCAAV